MTPPSILLVPTDFSRAAEAALDNAVALASKLGGTVYLLHTYELPIIGFPDGTLVPSAEMASRIVVDAETKLAACVEKRKKSSVRIVPILKQADAPEGILAAAAELSADFIIMGTHGRKGIARALIGSVTEAIVRVSPVPVLTVHAPA
jgi:nucleotide-binding universal stress UspA family protein